MSHSKHSGGARHTGGSVEKLVTQKGAASSVSGVSKTGCGSPVASAPSVFERSRNGARFLCTLPIRFYSNLQQLTRDDIVVLVPGFSLMTVGVLVLIAPALLTVALAMIITLLGFFVCIVTIKVMHLKRRLERLSREFEGQILLQRPIARPEPVDELMALKRDDKKVVLH